jgi:hypothetical protein
MTLIDDKFNFRLLRNEQNRNFHSLPSGVSAVIEFHCELSSSFSDSTYGDSLDVDGSRVTQSSSNYIKLLARMSDGAGSSLWTAEKLNLSSP